MRCETALLSAADEGELAERIEAGVIARAILDGCWPAVMVAATGEELRQLADRGRAAREHFVLANLGLVGMVAGGEASRLGLSADELSQEGYVGLIEAVDRFDAHTGVRFSTFAVYHIRNRVRRAALTRCGELHLSARQARTIIELRAVERELRASGAAAHPADIAGSVHRPEGWVRSVLSYERASSLDAVGEGVEDAGAGRALAEVERRSSAGGVARALDLLPVEQAAVLRLEFGFDGPRVPRVEVARRLGMSETSVRRVEARGLARLREVVGAWAGDEAEWRLVA